MRSLRSPLIAGGLAAGVLSGLLVSGLLTEVRAAADAPNVYCAAGAVPTCFSVAIETVPDGAGGTDVTVRLGNLQGASEYPVPLPTAGPAWARLHRVDVVGPDDGSFPADDYMTGVAMALTGGATGAGDVTQTWGVVPLVVEPGVARGYALGTDITLGGAEIVGCAAPPDLGYPYIRTCAIGGQTPEVVLNFAANGLWTAQQVRLTLVFEDPTGEWACEVSEVPRRNDTDPFSCERVGGVTPPTQLAQTIIFTLAVPSPAYVGDSYAVGARATSGLVVTFSALTPGTCTLSGSTVSFAAPGPCIIAADQAGNASYLAAPQATQSIIVEKRPQVVAFAPDPPILALVGSSLALGATGGASGNPVVFTSLTSATCTVSGSTASFFAAGDCTVAANQAGTAEYNPAAQVTHTITVSRRPQTIAFNPALPTTALLDSKLTVAATGGESPNPVTFTVLTPATCVLSGNMLSLTSIGACTVAADQVGDAIYFDAERVTATVAVVWPFGGFETPVTAAPTLNAVKAGQGVPLKFSLGGDRTLAILAADSPTSARVACAQGTASETEVPTVPAGGSSLTYDAVTGLYTYVWKTDKSWVGTCRQLTLRLTDGTSHTALFSFR